MALNPSNNYRITTPHAAVIVWNYDNRLGVLPTDSSTINKVNRRILSTISCVSIQTSKSKGSPVGSFQVVLAPTRDWVSEITAGSWCTILMSNQPITAAQLDSADPAFVKMIGKIESVKVDVAVDEQGARHTRYIVSGSDWGHVFNSVLYVDNLIASAKDPANQGNTAAILLQKMMLADGNTPKTFKVADNLVSLIGILGSSADGFNKVADGIGRLGTAIYDFNIPTEMAQYFNFIDANGDVNLSLKISNLLTLQTGKLVARDTYQDTDEAYGFIDPFSLQGTNTFWQVLMDNSNPALNEMYNEIEWEEGNNGKTGPSLTLFNRIKPFSYRANIASPLAVNILRSPFNLVKTHAIDNIMVTAISAGTNWRDKFNFVEIRPQDSSFAVLGNLTAQKSQGFDAAAFDREGFRPYIVGTKQFPVDPTKNSDVFNPDYLVNWVALLEEWYFDTHKLLNGTLTMKGSSEYIAVGNNIMFEAGLINPTANLNNGTSISKNTTYILAHIENVENTFTISDDARTYITTIQFVRGILVDQSRNLVGGGSLDELASSIADSSLKNSVNTFGTSDGLGDPSHPIDPDPERLHGT